MASPKMGEDNVKVWYGMVWKHYINTKPDLSPTVQPTVEIISEKKNTAVESQ